MESRQIPDRHCADGVAMIGVFESRESKTAALPYVVPVLNGNPQRGLHRARPVACKHDSSAPVGESAYKPVSQFGGTGVGKVAQDAVLEFRGLANDGLDEPRVAVTKVACPP